MSSQTITVTPEQLGLILAKVTHAQPIGFTSLTDARARKTGNPYGQVRKLVKRQAFVGFDYETSVGNARARQGMGADVPAFESKAHSWGERIADSCCLLRHPRTGELYLIVKVERECRPTYLTQQPSGVWSPVDTALVAPFLPMDESDVTANRQGLDRPVVYRQYRLDSLVTLTMAGQRYRIRRPATGAGPPTPRAVKPRRRATYDHLDAAYQRREREEDSANADPGDSLYWESKADGWDRP